MNEIRVSPFGAPLARRWCGHRLGSLVFAWMMLFGASGAWAACGPIPGGGTTVFNLGLGRVVISPDAAVGEIIATKQFSRVSSNTQIGTCSRGGNIFHEMRQGAPVAGVPNTYSTNVKGVGVRLKFYDGSGEPLYFPFEKQISGNVDVYMFPSSYYVVELVKTEPVTGSGPLTSGEVGRSRFDKGAAYASIFIPANGVTIVTPSCTVDAGSRNILVKLGKVPSKNFSGVGSTAGVRPFNIQLNCSAGVEAANTVFLRMDATADPSGQQGGFKSRKVPATPLALASRSSTRIVSA